MKCLITGFADGIGRALAHHLGGKGYAIVGLDCDQAKAAETLAELHERSIEAAFLPADLGDANAVAAAAHEAASHAPLAVVIHNAGINAVSRFEHADAASLDRILAVNLTAPMLLTAALLRHNAIATAGSLVFVCSLSHHVGYPGAAAYAASKDGLASYARSLSVALAPRPIHVLTVFPGPTRTAHARRHGPNNQYEARRMRPEVLAEAIGRALARRRRFLIPGWSNRCAALVGHWIPWLAAYGMRRTILDRLENENALSTREAP